MTARFAFLAFAFVITGIGTTAGAEEQTKEMKTPPPVSAGKCEQRLPPIGLYDAANNLLDAAYYAQWVLEDLICKYPENEEAKRALTKLNRAIEKAEGR